VKFADVIGQSEVKRRLVSMHRENRFPHALLLLGSEGSGALELAYAMATYDACTGDKSGGDSCGECPSCKKAQKMAHPDIHSIFPSIRKNDSTTSETFQPEWREVMTAGGYFGLPEWTAAMKGLKATEVDDDDDTAGGGKADNKQAQILKDAAVAIHQSLSLKPYEAKRQFMIIWKPELMNEVTSNSILKILEEPPTDTAFILVSEDTERILPTILSRTQVVGVPPIDEGSLAEALTARLGIGGDEAVRTAHIARGNFVAAKRLVAGAEDRRRGLEIFKGVMRSAWKRDVKGLSDTAEEMKKLSREQAKNVLTYWRGLLRESFVMNLECPQLNYISKEEEEFLSRFAPFIHLGNIEELTRRFDKAAGMIEQNGNIKMVMLDLVLNLTALIRNSKRPE
jgi:DNA polymerase-3 subunit delta'